MAAACTQESVRKHGKPHGVVRDDQPDAREGQAGRRGVAEAVILPALIFSMVRRTVSTAKAPKRRVARIQSTFAARIAICRSDIKGSLKDSSINQRIELTGIAHVPPMRHCANPWGRSGMAILAP